MQQKNSDDTEMKATSIEKVAHKDATPRITKRGAERLDRLFKIATVLFLKHGYNGTCIDEIVRKAGGSKTIFYRHYGNKPKIFCQVVQTLCIGIVEEFTDDNYEELPLVPGLKVIGQKLVGVLLSSKHLAMQRLIYAESAKFPEIGKIWYEQAPQKARAKIAEFLLSKITTGELAPIDHNASAQIFHDLLLYTPLNLALTGQLPNHGSWCEQHIDAVTKEFLSSRSSNPSTLSSDQTYP